ncbi:LOW QUALITY PROTEIN: metabotropic glutamate receptor 1-like [Gadus morhua]|uniref:LOW QUALITY PROTEIN: metabotropic glutamate receptor 1-like n=1 Tax=Gadus morhua TaxID=8049 RepID=UPI0011B65805|nr:LOW QUALITY PROTEIN: metabotropic glutamate receptor 1-like [Gadus morhua]
MTATSVDALKERSNITSIRLISRVVAEVCAALQQPLREFAKNRTLFDQWSEEGEYSFPALYITPVVGEWQEGGGCEPITLRYLEWSNPESVIQVVLSCVGILITSFVAFIFVLYRDTPVVKSSSRELCYIILAGIFLGYLCPFTLIARPTVASCYLQRLLVGLSAAMCYSALVTKTNRIARILAGSKKKICTRKPRFMSAWAQVVIASLLVSVQLSLEITLIILEPPMPVKSYPSIREVFLICNTSNVGMVAPLGYNGLLIMSCTYYAFKTRNVPANFNEAKYIAFTMYTTCIIWLAFVPIYFGSNYKIITTSFSVSLSVTVALGCMFTPKMYIILAKPERNVRSAFTTSDVVRMHVGDGKIACHNNSFLNMFRRKKNAGNGSSNGKSVSWSEPGARHPPKGDHMWHRLSVHVKRQDVCSNQTAVIRPLTNAYHSAGLELSELSTKTLYNVAEEDESLEMLRYHPPDAPPPTMTPSGQAASGAQAVPHYAREPLATQPHPGLLPQHLLPQHVQEEEPAEGGGVPVYLQAPLGQGFPAPGGLYGGEGASAIVQEEEEEEEEVDNEQLGLLRGYMYNNAQVHEQEEEGDAGGEYKEEEEDEDDEVAQLKVAIEAGSSMALMPPSPFRDCVAPPKSPFPDSPVSESVLCTPTNVPYAAVILRDYKQTSSTL